MTNWNIQQPWDSLEKITLQSNKNIELLLQEAMQSELKNDSGIINPVLYDGISYSDISTTIREKMKYLRDSSDGEYTNISNDGIDKIKDGEIIKKITVFARPLKNARRNLYLSIKRNFPNIWSKIPSFDEKILLQKIEDFDENEINKLYLNNKTLSQFISQYFWISRESLIFRSRDFKELFATSALKNNSPDLFSRTENAAIAYKNHGIAPNLSLIRELVSFYGTQDKNKKKEICDFFDIKISLSSAVRSWFMGENDVETIAKKEFIEIWDKLDNSSQKSLVQILKYDDDYEIDFSKFDIDHIDQYFSSKKMKDTIARAIIDDLEKNKIALGNQTGFIRDIIPEIDENGLPKIHNGFLKKIIETLPSKNGTSKIANLEKLVAWSTLVFQDEAGKTQYFNLDATDIDIGEYDFWVTFSNISGSKEWTIGWVKSTEDINYDTLYGFLSQIKSGHVFTASEFAAKKSVDPSDWNIGTDHINGDDSILDISSTEDIMTLGWFIREINNLDPKGEKIGLEVWVAFASKWVLDNGKEYEGVWTITEIKGSNITINNGSHESQTVTFEEFLNGAQKQGFRRIAKLESKSDFLSVLQSGEFGVDSHAKLDWYDLVIEGDHHHSHDSHGDHGWHDNKKKKYEFFQSKSGWHIRINGIDDGFVNFGEYISPTSLADVQKIWNAGKLSNKEKQWLYENQQMSYGSFIEYLKKNDLKATTDNILAPNTTDTYHPHDPHLKWSLFSKIWSWWSIADIMHGFENLTHGIEHFFEKNSKLNASRFALTMWKKLGLPADIMAQLQADEVTGVKEIIEKIQEKIKNLNGPKGREKAIHIAHNKNARPEEVGAAILHMVKWYGSLYAEDIAHYQWSESFINWLLYSCGFRGKELTAMKLKAREKSKTLLGNEAWSELSEEEMIWGFMKMMDGNHDKYPVAATLVKAMGWPSGFENAWRKDGFDGAYEKWMRQAGDLVNAEARVDHGLSALSTHEYHTAIGSMEKAAEKSPDPSIQTLPVVWALGGYSKYLSTKGNQKIKSYADGKWHSLHAFSLYQHTFREALRVIAPNEVANLDTYIKNVEYDGHTKNSDKVKKWVQWLARLWRNYHNKWLHDMLQWKNMWLVENANKDEKIKAYFKKFSEIHQNNSWDEAHGDDSGWYIQHWYVGSPIVSAVEVDDKILNSMDRILRKIPLDSHQLRMDDNKKERYWDPIVKIIKNLNESSQDEKMKKAQFLQYRSDILVRFNKAFSSKPQSKDEIKKQGFYGDLLDMGIDISVIYEPGGNLKKKFDRTAEKDYLAWKNWWRRGGSVSNTEIQSVKNTINSVISSREDAWYQWVWKNRDNTPDTEWNQSDVSSWMAGINEIWESSWAD